MLLTLPEDALHHVLLQLEGPQDLLRLSRVCRRLHAAVSGATVVWRTLFAASYPQQCRQLQSPHTDYRALYQQRWIAHAKEARLTARVQRMRLGSDVAHLQRELAELTARLAKEQLQCRHLQQQLAHSAAAGRAAASSSTAWQLAAVRLYQNQVVQQATAVPHAAHVASLEQAVKVSRLEVRTLTAAIAARRGRLATTKRRLAALEG